VLLKPEGHFAFVHFDVPYPLAGAQELNIAASRSNAKHNPIGRRQQRRL
jgi:hypothetical protein